MSGEGRAALITIDWRNPDEPDVMWTIFAEEDGKPDPVRMCEGVEASVKGDWPNHEHHIIANQRARDLMGDRRMRDWFGIDTEGLDRSPEVQP